MRRAVATSATGLAAASAVVLLPVAAHATVGLTVSTTTDIGATAASCGNTNTSPPNPLSLREAVCIANNYGNTQPVVITVPPGTYTLSSGELKMGKVSGSNITLNGAGSSATIIDGNHASRVLDLDPNLLGGVTTAISGVTITNGRDGTFGGAGIIAGSGNSSNIDRLTVSSSVLSNNQANFSAPTASNKPGGAIQFIGGALTLTNDTFSGNQSFSSAGGAVYYSSQSTFANQGVTVTGSTFTGNSTANSGTSGTSGGGGLAVGGTVSVSSVTNSTFTSNSSTSSSNETAAGGAIQHIQGTLTVTGTKFSGNSVSNTVNSTGNGSIIWTSGSTTMHYNRFAGDNTGTADVMTNSGGGSIDATENWWGCNTGPGGSGCETTSGTGLTVAPRLQLSASASPTHVVGPNGTSTITASLLTDSVGGAVAGSNLAGAFDGVPVTFYDPAGDATVTSSSGNHTSNLSSGTATIDYHSNTTTGSDNVTVGLDNATTTATLDVNTAPAFTSANSAHFTPGTAGSVSITTSGYPTPGISSSGSLPSGLTFTNNGNGTATVAGTPAAGTGGSYTLNLQASNGYGSPATQTLTVYVDQAPSITSSSSATFTTGTSGSFTFTTTGSPTPSLSKSGSLPSGVSFTDNGNGTATLSGTPAAGTGGSYPLTVTASNGINPDATQGFTLTVNQAPAVTGNPSDQKVSAGASVSFTASASGYPTPSVQWQRSTDGGGSWSDIAGATSTTYTFAASTSDDGNQYRAVFSNSAGGATSTAATLNVQAVSAHDLEISEFRLAGPTVRDNWYVDVHNTTGSRVNLHGWSLAVQTGPGTESPVSLPDVTLPAGATILVAGNGYTLSGYAAPDVTSSVSPAAGGGVAVVAPNGTTTDAAGIAGSDAAVREGTGLAQPTVGSGELAFVRTHTSTDWTDTDDNAADFTLVATDAGSGTPGATYGAPGPLDLASPRPDIASATSTLLDPSAASTQAPNRVVSGSTLVVRRTLTNNTGSTVHSVRLRILSLTTVGNTTGTQAQLKVQSSTTDGYAQGVTLDSPSGSTGGLNSTLTVPIGGAGLAPGASINVNLQFLIVRGGKFSFTYGPEVG